MFVQITTIYNKIARNIDGIRFLNLLVLNYNID